MHVEVAVANKMANISQAVHKFIAQNLPEQTSKTKRLPHFVTFSSSSVCSVKVMIESVIKCRFSAMNVYSPHEMFSFFHE